MLFYSTAKRFKGLGFRGQGLGVMQQWSWCGTSGISHRYSANKGTHDKGPQDLDVCQECFERFLPKTWRNPSLGVGLDA